MTYCQASWMLRENTNFKSRFLRSHSGLEQFNFGMKHVKGERNLGDILSDSYMLEFEGKRLSYSLEFDLQAHGSGVLLVGLSEKQGAEAKELM